VETIYKRQEYHNGIRLITEKIPHFRSVSIGLWFGVGSVFETSEENGLSHFIEHMLFKGTETRTAKQIAEIMDSVGGQLNAFTAKECTCYYSKVIDDRLELAVSLLADMVQNSVFDPVEMNKEKGVIMEEIYMYEDSPEDLAHDLIAAAFFGDHPLAQPILGTKESLEPITRDHILNYMNEFYNPQNLVIAVAGNFDEGELDSFINKYFGGWDKKSKEKRSVQETQPHKQILFRQKDIEQMHLCIGSPGVKMGNDDVYPLLVFNALFGGGMSSRLFQKVREERGLAYSIYSYPSIYKSGGLFNIYTSMKPNQLADVLSIIVGEIQNVKGHSIEKEEFQSAIEQVKGNYILGLESTSSRMTAIGRSELLMGKVLTPSEVLEKIDRVTIDDVYRITDIVFDPNRTSAALVGKEDMSDKVRALLEF